MVDYNVLGLMSGTSLDGLDIAYCHFLLKSSKWSFQIIEAETFEYKPGLREKLLNAHKLTAFELSVLDAELTYLTAGFVYDFVTRNSIKPDFISSHGHTVFHQPNGVMQQPAPAVYPFTKQIINGGMLAALTGYNVVCDFRTADVALGGQGAPLVPAGDKLLFGEYDYCLNLGGIANISFNKNGERIASDVCFANMALNYLTGFINLEYDKDGNIAAKGSVDTTLFNQLNDLSFHARPFPKSTGKEYFEEEVKPLLDASSLSVEDKLCTFCGHITFQIKNIIDEQLKKSPAKGIDQPPQCLLITGGGAYNNFLTGLFKKSLPVEIVIPAKNIIEFKEAMIFAFLGVLRVRNELNVFKSVTGSKQNTCSGAIYKGNMPV